VAEQSNRGVRPARRRGYWRRKEKGSTGSGYFAGPDLLGVVYRVGGAWVGQAHVDGMDWSSFANGTTFDDESQAKYYTTCWIALARGQDTPRVCRECGHSDRCHIFAPPGHLTGVVGAEWKCSPKREGVWCHRADGKRVCGAWVRRRK
jgi:hypothetical protein